MMLDRRCLVVARHSKCEDLLVLIRYLNARCPNKGGPIKIQNHRCLVVARHGSCGVLMVLIFKTMLTRNVRVESRLGVVESHRCPVAARHSRRETFWYWFNT